MAFETALSELQREDFTDANKILESLLNPKNIDMKTHIVEPVDFAILESLIKELEGLLTEANQKRKLKLPLTKEFLKNTIKQLKLFMVSWERLGRTEITKTLQSIRNEEGNANRTIVERLLGMNK